MRVRPREMRGGYGTAAGLEPVLNVESGSKAGPAGSKTALTSTGVESRSAETNAMRSTRAAGKKNRRVGRAMKSPWDSERTPPGVLRGHGSSVSTHCCPPLVQQVMAGVTG